METASSLRHLVFSGPWRQLGQAYGEELRAEIGRFYALRRANATAQTARYGRRAVPEAELLALSERCLKVLARFSPEGYEELLGVSEGAGLPLPKIWLMNALTDLRDVAATATEASSPSVRASGPSDRASASSDRASGPSGRAPEGLPPPPGAEGEGCSSILLSRERGGGHPLAAQTWDLDVDQQPFVVLVERHPDRGPPTVALTTAGCLSLTGINAAGVAVGTNNIRATDARPGVGYLDVLHAMLGQPRAADAAQLAAQAPRAAAHYFFALDAQEAHAVECTATQHAHRALVDAAAIYTNHIQDPDLRALEVMGDPGSTHARADRLQALCGEGEHGPASLRAALSDHEGGAACVCRHEVRGIRSNGAVVLEPAHRRLHAIGGPPCGSAWRTVELPA